MGAFAPVHTRRVGGHKRYKFEETRKGDLVKVELRVGDFYGFRWVRIDQGYLKKSNNKARINENKQDLILEYRNSRLK